MESLITDCTENFVEDYSVGTCRMSSAWFYMVQQKKKKSKSTSERAPDFATAMVRVCCAKKMINILFSYPVAVVEPEMMIHRRYDAR